ncbi:MAG: glutathione peroxidase [Flavobacterium sp.]|jgi:glutathione peroxidase|uniref:glutathione peroxidase n=1 Tax=Flavobacterium sp. TaxID=239 RepID=UPI002B47F2B7|nr:glutathione peroxidase [Flavobacterium sp.]WRH74075.1 MAG: glutathione peroxidase [Flavobacterium sp.]
MKKVVTLFSVVALFFSCQNQAQKKQTTTVTATTTPMAKETIYQFKVEDLSGNTFDFSTLKGKKILVVNTASECGLTPQYEQLQAIYEKYKDKNFVIVGFPANNFGAQEPGTNQEIATFCQQNFGVSFPMMAKISVKGGDMHSVYQFLTQKAKNGLQDSEVQWNFQKYLINENGELAKVVSPRTLPTDAEITNWIEGK